MKWELPAGLLGTVSSLYFGLNGLSRSIAGNTTCSLCYTTSVNPQLGEIHNSERSEKAMRANGRVPGLREAAVDLVVNNLHLKGL